jgi:hypothetical protein
MTYYQRIIYQNTLEAADWHGWFPAYFTGSRAKLAGFTRTGGAGAGPSKRGTSERRPRRARRFGEKPISGTDTLTVTYTPPGEHPWKGPVTPLIVDLSDGRYFGIEFNRLIGALGNGIRIEGSANLRNWVDATPSMPAGASVYVTMNGWGWNTGHWHHCDDLLIKSGVNP